MCSNHYFNRLTYSMKKDVYSERPAVNYLLKSGGVYWQDWTAYQSSFCSSKLAVNLACIYCVLTHKQKIGDIIKFFINKNLRRNKQRKIPLKSLISEGFWSEWGGSNARSPGPKNFREVFCAYLWLFLVFSTRFYLLFGTLKTTVFAYSAPGCGNQCGQKRFPHQAGAFLRPGWEAFLS